MGTIQNGKDTPLNARAGFLPQMQGGLQSYYQPMTFIQLGKFLVSGFVQETGTPTNFRGVMVPHKPRELEIKKQGERKWKWWDLYCTPELVLKVDDAASYLDDPYRCMASTDYSLEGFKHYVIIQDYAGVISNMVYDSGKFMDDGNQVAPAQLVTE